MKRRYNALLLGGGCALGMLNVDSGGGGEAREG
jgi:hypothetical protein